MTIAARNTPRRLTINRQPSKSSFETLAGSRNDALNERLKRSLHQRSGRELRLAWRVLVLGSGCCELVNYLGETYGQRAIAVAPTATELRKPNDRTQQMPVRCLRGDAHRLSYFSSDKSKDAVVMLGSLNETTLTRTILRQMYGALRPGGEILLVDSAREQWAPHLWNRRHQNAEKMKLRLAQAGFRETEVRLVEDNDVIWVSAVRPALSP